MIGMDHHLTAILGFWVFVMITIDHYSEVEVFVVVIINTSPYAQAVLLME